MSVVIMLLCSYLSCGKALLQDSGFLARSGPSTVAPVVKTESTKAAAAKVLEAGRWLDERQPDRALEALNAAQKLAPEEIPGFYWADAYYQKNRFPDVVAWGESHLYEDGENGTRRLKASSAYTLLIYAAALCEAGEWTAAKQVYSSALQELNETDGKPNFAVMQDDSVMGEPVVADRFRAAVHAALGMSATNHSAIIQEYEYRKALRLYSRNVSANYYLSRLLKGQGNRAESERYAARAAQYASESVREIMKIGP